MSYHKYQHRYRRVVDSWSLTWDTLTTGTRAALRRPPSLNCLGDGESEPNFSAAASKNNSELCALDANPKRFSSSRGSKASAERGLARNVSPRYAWICLAVLFGQPHGGQERERDKEGKERHRYRSTEPLTRLSQFPSSTSLIAQRGYDQGGRLNRLQRGVIV